MFNKKVDYEICVFNRTQARKKTNELDLCRFKDYIPKLELEYVSIFFGRKEVQRRNEGRVKNYDDCIRIYSEFAN